MTVRKFTSSNNLVSPLTIVSMDGKINVTDNNITPVSSGIASLLVEQTAGGQWKRYEKTLSLEISKKELLVKAPDITCVYGSPIPDIKLVYDGFVLDDTEADFIKKPVISCSASDISDTGQYPIKVSGGEIENYDLTYVDGKLSILKADQDITWGQQLSKAFVGDKIELRASATSGLTVSFKSSDESVAVVTSQEDRYYLNFLKSGNAAITAMQEGNANYNAAATITKTVTVDTHVSSVELNETKLTLNVGQSYSLTATVTPEDATNRMLAWSSSDNDVIVVDNDGNISALATGNAIVTATSIDNTPISASCSINVVKLAESITLNEDAVTAEVGAEFQLDATILPEDTSDKRVLWSSSNENMATVNDNGLVKIIAIGYCRITANTIDGSDLSAHCDIQSVLDVKGINSDDNALSVVVDKNTIVVTNKDPQTIVRVFSIQGSLVVETTESVITIVPSGLYIVKAGTEVFKFVISASSLR